MVAMSYSKVSWLPSASLFSGSSDPEKRSDCFQRKVTDVSGVERRARGTSVVWFFVGIKCLSMGN
jgi:hypothetical protein